MNEIKIKPLSKEQILICIDRLTRFKNPEDKYLRVFYDLITKNMIIPKYKKSDLEKLDYSLIKEMAEKILNTSLSDTASCDFSINKKIYDYETNLFETDENTRKLLENKINYESVISMIDSDSPQNLQWVKALKSDNDIKSQRLEMALRFPVEKLLIVEGATEEILLPEFGKICDYNFDKYGVYLLPAGGKNQVVKMYYKYREMFKFPIFVLLDKDAKRNLEEIAPKLREIDKIHIINCGEFEDLLPVSLIKKTLEIELKNISVLEKEKLDEHTPRVQFLEDTFKKRGMHEFKKVEFAQMIKQNVKSKQDLTPEIIEIINQIREL